MNPKPGYGTMLTKPDKSTAGGYDDGVKYSSAYSLRTYSNTGKYGSPANTNATSFQDSLVYLVEVRGDRSVRPQDQTQTTTPATATNLRSSGPLKIGNVVTNVTNANGNFAGVANPYACTIDFSKLTKTGLKNGYYVWDPTIGTLGAWVYIDATDYSATPDAGAYTSVATNRFIQSGQAFMVSTLSSTPNSTGSITFSETAKNPSNTSSVFWQGEGSGLSVNLYQVGDTSNLFLDGTINNFSEDFSNTVDELDILKPGNITENLCFYNKGKYLMKEKRSLPTAADTLYLQLWKTTKQKYQFALEASKLPVGLKAYMIDRYSNAQTEITGNATYNFDINSDAASAASNRFIIVFNQSSILPIGSASLKANPQDGGVALSWTVLNENNMSSYVVEKSADGRSFITLGTVTAKAGVNANSVYNSFDAEPVSGMNYYRVKMIGKDGSYTYTAIARATVTSLGEMLITVTPNPVQNSKVILRFANAPKGTYQVTVYNSSGSAVTTKNIEHIGGSATYTLQNKTLPAGMYEVNIKNTSSHFTQTIKVAVIQ